MSRFAFLKGETLEEYNVRQDRATEINSKFDDILHSIFDLTRQTNKTSQTMGFFEAWISIMFADLDDAAKAKVLTRFTQYDSELMCIKIGKDTETATAL
jgi:hypothetical protein